MLAKRFEEHNRAWIEAVGDADGDGEAKEYSRDVSRSGDSRVWPASILS